MEQSARNANAAEGWDLFDYNGSGLMEIERDDEANIFADDASAVAYVETRAAEGSQRHIDALAQHRADEAKIDELRAR